MKMKIKRIKEEDERDGEECRVEGRRVSRQQQHADDTWMTCAQDTLSLSQCHVRHRMCAVKHEKI